MNTSSFVSTDRTRLKRLPDRGAYDRETIYRILDEGLVCHVGFALNGQPFIIPTIYARRGDLLFMHGSAASRMLRELQKGIAACVTVTLLDGLVLARSAFHHSINYRSVVAFGTARLVEDAEAKLIALLEISEHVMKGRWDDVRPPTEREMAATSVIEFAIEEASAKTRSGPPLDDEEDYGLPVWAGELPLRTISGNPVADPRLPDGIALPEYLTEYVRSRE